MGYEFLESTQPDEGSLFQVVTETESPLLDQKTNQPLDAPKSLERDKPIREPAPPPKANDSISEASVARKATRQTSKPDALAFGDALETAFGNKRQTSRAAVKAEAISKSASRRGAKQGKGGTLKNKTSPKTKKKSSQQIHSSKQSQPTPKAPSDRGSVFEPSNGALDSLSMVGSTHNKIGANHGRGGGGAPGAGGLSAASREAKNELDRSKSDTGKTTQMRGQPSGDRGATSVKRKRNRKRNRPQVSRASDSERVSAGPATDLQDASDDVMLAEQSMVLPAPAPKSRSARTRSNAPLKMEKPERSMQFTSKDETTEAHIRQDASPKTVQVKSPVALTIQETSRLRQAKVNLNFRRSESNEILSLARLALRARDFEQATTWTQWVIKRNDRHLRDALELRRQIQNRRKRP